MKYEQVDTALSFLFSTNMKYIVSQVRYKKDINLLRLYINEKILGHFNKSKNYISIQDKRIYFQDIGDINMQHGQKSEHLFFIDRKCDDYEGEDLNI